MAKELPYFKFTVAEWLMGDITLQDFSVQGTYINTCAYYWQKGCSLPLALLEQRLSNASADIKHLLNCGIIKHDSTTGNISIKFLDEQWTELYRTHLNRVKSGSKGGKAKLKPSSSQAQAKLKHLDKDKIKIRYIEFLSLFNSITGRSFKGDAKSIGQFKARIEEGYDLEKFKIAIQVCFEDDYHKQNRKYLTPEFITRSDKLQKYFITPSEQKQPSKEIDYSSVHVEPKPIM